MSAGVREAMRVYDDTALETLANRGLLRRAAKDVENGKVCVTNESAERIVVTADGERVEIDARGPRAAQCSCPSAGICRHRLAAVLILRTPAQDPQADAAPAGSVMVPAPPIDAGAEIAALEPTAILRWAGKAALRAAVEMLGEESARIEPEGSALRVRIGDVRPPVLLLAGQGLEGIMSKAQPSLARALHAAAVLAVRRERGVDDADLVDPTPAATTAEGPDQSFLHAVCRAIEEALPVALVHAPEVLEERLFELALSSRADDLPALSRRLRQLSGSIRAKRARDFTIEGEALLAGLAATHALAMALATADPAKQARFRGVVRQDYVPAGNLALQGLGARSWKMRSGARGVTGYFFAPESARTMTVSLARADAQDASFDAAAAFGEALWQAGPLRHLVAAQVTLQHARVSPSGRLSTSRETMGWCTSQPLALATMESWPITFSDWNLVEGHLRQRHALTLSTATTGPSILLLVPARLGPLAFDPIAQAFVWPIADRRSRWIVLRLPRRSTSSIDEREPIELVQSWAEVRAVFVEAVATRGSFDLQPIAILGLAFSDGPDGMALLDPALAQQGHPAEAQPEQTAHAIAADTRLPGQRALISRHAALIDETADALLGLVELGMVREQVEIERTFNSLAGRAATIGLTTLSASCRRLAVSGPQDRAAALLRAVHVCDRLDGLSRTLPWLDHPCQPEPS